MANFASKICAGSGLPAGRASMKQLQKRCPICGASVVISYRNRLKTHGKPKRATRGSEEPR